MSFLQDNLATTGGWLTNREGIFLYNTARKIPTDGSIIEIGSWKGRSTVCLGLGAKEGNKAKIYAIDPHTGSSEHVRKFGAVDTYQEFLDNISHFEVSEYIVPLRDTSENVAKNFDKQVDFVLVDGAHEYSFVKTDEKAWFPKLKEGSLIAFHDCWHTVGVHLYTTKLLLTSSQIKHPKLIDTLTVFEKTAHATLQDRLENILFLVKRFFFGWIGTLRIDYTGTYTN